MKRRYLSALAASLALLALGLTSVGSASAANLKEHGVTEPTGFLAIYGTPAANGVAASTPVGVGLGRNFGFGANLLFCASTVQCKPSENLDIELEGKVKAEAKQSYLGGTLMSNKTGANNPLSFAVQFADFQNNVVSEVATQSYSDTFDRPWIAEICSPASEVGKCKTDPLFNTPAGSVKIEDVSFDLGGIVVQGTVWAKWENSVEAGKPPCIKLTVPPEGAGANQNLIVTQPAADVGLKVVAVSGKACLISANNYWYVGKEPFIEIANE